MNVILDKEAKLISEAVAESHGAVIVWGAGSCAWEFFDNHKNLQSRLSYFVDLDSKKEGTDFSLSEVKKKIFGPDKIEKDNAEETVVIIATMYFKSVIETLEAMGFLGSVYSAFHVNYAKGQGDYKGLEKHIEPLKALLYDGKSQNIVDIILEKRKRLDIDYTDIFEKKQYFVKDIIKKDKAAVFIDGGAFDGATVDEFIHFQNGEFKKIYSFEMNEFNYKKISKEKYDTRVEFLNYGLWNEDAELHYDMESTSSSVTDTGAYCAKCTSIDKICQDEHVTFIKMDIEGAEEKALYGAKETILRNHPQLAICLYHKPDDIWQLPFLIKKWVPEYKMYIRHHSNNFTETVLYAVV